ncbi:unnamed protein product [Rotaria sp. Silwood2]|nr:unnamed protein product [Rotaria sp. Silwood2]
MNKPKRTPTLDSFVIKKPKNTSIISSDPNLNQDEQATKNVTSYGNIVNVNQHINIDNVNETTTPLVSLENNLLSIQDNHRSLTNSTVLEERCLLVSSICSSGGDDERIDIRVQTSNYDYGICEKENAGGRSAVASTGIIGCEKLISNLLSLKKANENIDILLTMFKSTNNSKELCAHETYSFSDDVLKIVSDLRVYCETYLLECVNNRPLVSNSLPTYLQRDPGAYPNLPRFSSDELKHLIALGPYQPRLSTYPKLKRTKKDDNGEISVEVDLRKTTSFQARWYVDYPLIEYSILKDRVYCFVCRLFGHGPGALCGDPAWTTNGLQQWTKMTGKDGKLIKHFQSNVHISAHQRLQMFKKEDSHVDIQLDKERIFVNHHRQELLKLNRYIISSLLDATKFLARQSLSFRAEVESEGNFNQIVSLLRRYNNTIDQWYKDKSTRSYRVTYLSNDAQNDFISIIGKAVHDSIINRLNKSLFWSVMVDSTPDISHKDMMSIIVRFVNEDDQAEERLLSIHEIKSQSYDGASNMSGEYKGVKTIISKLIGHEVIFVPCCAHRSNKIVEHSTQNSLEVKKFFDLCENIYVFITGSTKRYSVLRDIYSTSMNEDALSVKQSTDTRWSSHYNSIIAIYESFTEIIHVLDELCNDNDKMTKLEARAIREKLVSYEFYCILLFIKHLMSITNALTTTLQDENLDILLAIDTLTKTICLLNKIRNDEDTINKLLELAKERMLTHYDVDADEEFDKKHRRRFKPLRIDSNAHNEAILCREAYYRKIFYQIVDQLNNEYVDLLTTLEEKLKYFISLWPSKINNFRTEDAEQIKTIVPGIDSSDLLYYDVQLLKENLHECSSIKDIMTLFSKNNYKSLYPRLYRVYTFILSLPVTVASNERMFSRLKLIKNYLRSKMFDDRLMNLILCSSEKDILDSLNLDELVTVWRTKTRRHLPTQ